MRTSNNQNSAGTGRWVVAALIPLAAFGLQWIFWNSFKSFAWSRDRMAWVGFAGQDAAKTLRPWQNPTRK